MKFIVAFVLIALVACISAEDPSDEQIEKAFALTLECIEVAGTTVEAVEKLMTGHFDNVDEQVKAFLNCYLERNGFLKEGIPQEDVINEKLIPIVGEDKVKPLIEKCIDVKGSDIYDTAFKFYQCYYKFYTSWF